MHAYTHPILTCEEAIAWEKDLLHGENAAWTAMNRAGCSLGRALLRDYAELGAFPKTAPILVLLGKGHNGGDALIAAGEILRHHPDASIAILPAQPVEECRTLTRRALDKLQQNSQAQLVTLAKVVNNPYAICLDGLLGMSFRPPLRDTLRSLIDTINRHNRISLRAAVDLPSGIGDSGFRADFTYATGIAKAPLFTTPDSGRIRYLDIGFFEDGHQCQPSGGESILLPGILDRLRGLRPPASDKRSYGHLYVLAGSRTMPGALLMNVRAALQAGCGLVTAFAPESVAASFAAAAPEAMWVPWPETPDGNLALEGRHLLLERLKPGGVLLAGSGLGREPETHGLIQDLVKNLPIPMVLDADALSPEIAQLAAKRHPEAGAIITTPHTGEFQRMAHGEAEPCGSTALRTFSHDHRLITILKGPITRISDGTSVINATFGGPVLARGGSGDILAGLTGGLLAQTPTSPLDAACSAAAWHGLAATRLAQTSGPQAVSTTDLLSHLNPVLRDV